MVQVRKIVSCGDDRKYLDGEGSVTTRHHPLIGRGYSAVKALR